MTAQDLEGVKPAAKRVTETEAWSATGVPILVVGLAIALVGVAVLVLGLTMGGGPGPVALIIVGVLLLIFVDPTFRGLVSVQAGEARVVQLFGQYHGTVRSPGLQWVNPFAKRRQVSTRIRNLETPQAKVNDADGNPIEIAAVVVWQVADTALAIYAVDNFERFVAIQAETAVRHIASTYAYDTRGSGELSLRDNADEITGQLTAEIAARVAAAGVLIIESRLTRLSYAPEIAQAMLRQQQASAVVGARQRIVEGAVGMVQLALQRLEEEGVVELDEERKATMVSNLLVVLCSEQATQPIVNAGSLYQ
ncbi:MAG TPA: SPFH domain-containing protein [Streptosporangiaceae bacterium]|jgi:regulator of protease activity HflC (stomatin/prohibitin superfamily)